MRENPTKETWITNAILVTQDAKRRVMRGCLRIIDGRIDKITSSPPSRLSTKARVIDARGNAVLPGFIQPHVHLCQTLFRNQADDMELLDWLKKRIWKFEAAHTPETLGTSARLGIYELLSSGTTCILDMATVRHTDSIFQAVKETGLRASIGKCLMDNPATCPKVLRESTADALKEAEALLKKWNGTENDRIRVSFAPRFVISCTEQLLKNVTALAREHQALIHTHASENRKEVALVKKMVGRDNIEYLHAIGMTSPKLVLAHCIWLKPVEIAILKRTGTHVVHCPSSNMKLASGFAPVPDMLEQGINVALGADGAPCNNNLNMFTEMRLAALIHKPQAGPKAMRAQMVLDMATRNGAKALNWFEDIGSIEVGKKADLTSIDLGCPENNVPAYAVGNKLAPEAIVSSIVYSSQSMHVRFTMVDGRVLYHHGKTPTIDRLKLMNDVRSSQEKIGKTVKEWAR